MNEYNKNQMEIYDDDSFLRLEMHKPEFDDVPDGWIEISYRQDHEDGWGAGGDEYVYRSDLVRLAEGVRSVLSGGEKEFSCSCGVEERRFEGRDVLMIGLKRNDSPVSYDLTVSMLETLEREVYITIRKKNLSVQELNEYTDVFFSWEEDFGKQEQ